MLFVFSIYKNLRKNLINTVTWVINSAYLWNPPTNSNPLYKSKTSVKLKLYISFFSDFLVWNYLINKPFSAEIAAPGWQLNSKISLKSVSYLPTPTVISSYLNYSKLVGYGLSLLYRDIYLKLKVLVYKTFSFSWYYVSGFIFILFIDACLTDDEPLWEPIEWSLVQTWILFIFGFAWIAENLIVSRYGSYAGRDKRVWMAWYKTFWLIEGYYVLNYGVAVVLVIVPFYFETNYNLSFVYSWWSWFSKVFFYKFTIFYTIILLIAFWVQINIRWVGFKKALFLISLVNILLAYLIYTHFIIIFFGYFTDPIWYQKTRFVDYVQLSHEPAKWGWGSSKKDHFTYHGVKTVLWFKNDGPFATSFLFCQIFFFICLFCLFFYWVVLFRRVYSLSEVPITYTTYCVSSLKQFFFFFLYFYILILLSFLSHYWRFPIEYFFTLEYKSWYVNFISILIDYPNLLITSIFNL